MFESQNRFLQWLAAQGFYTEASGDFTFFQEKDPRNGPENNTCFVDFQANFGRQTGPPNGPKDQTTQMFKDCSRRKSAVENNTESRFSSLVIKRIQEKIPKNGLDNNTIVVEFQANFGLQNCRQNQRPDYSQAFVGARSRRKSAVQDNTE